MKNITTVERYPWFVKVFASPHPALNLLTLIPLMLFLALLGLDSFNFESIPTYLIIAVAGWFYWTFFEYGFHRWVYHGKYKPGALKNFIDSFHIYHHRNLDDHSVITAGPMMIIPIAFALLLPWFVIFYQQWDYFAVIGLSLLVNYYFYEWVHFLIHRTNLNIRYMKFITKFHNHHHHKNWTKNFGNTTGFWDTIFGTYEHE